MNLEFVKNALITAQLCISVITDVHCYKVKNIMIIIFIAAGAVLNILSISQGDFFSSILGLFLPFIALMPLYILKMLGAGDIKLFCSIGFLLGVEDVLYSIIYSYLFGLILAIFIMLARDNLASRFKRLYNYMKCSILTVSILPYDDLSTKSDGRMHFTIPIAVGTMAVILF